MHRWPRRSGGPGGWRISRGLKAAKAVPDTPLVAVRATTVRLSLRYSTYIPLKTLVHPGCFSIPTHSTPFALGKTVGLCTGSAQRARTHGAPRAPRIFRYLFIIVPKVRPPLILVPPMLSNRRCGRGKVALYSLQYNVCASSRAYGYTISRCFAIHDFIQFDILHVLFSII